jgi:hypothetical protein
MVVIACKQASLESAALRDVLSLVRCFSIGKKSSLVALYHGHG